MGHELVATGYGRRRLVAWLDGGGLERSRAELPEARRARIAEAFLSYGDNALHETVLGALLIAPPPVTDVLVEEVCALTCGWSIAGRVMNARLPRRTFMLLDGHGRDASAVTRLVLHETAHCWLHTPVVGDIETPLVSTAGYAAVSAVAAEEGWLADVQRISQTKEREADALAAVWLRSTEIAP